MTDKYIKDLFESVKRVKRIQISEQSGAAGALFNNAKIVMDKKYREKSATCKKHLGVIKLFKKNERLMLMACNGKAKAAAARAGASFLEKNVSKCGKDKKCRTAVDYHVDQLRQFAAHEEKLSKQDIEKIKAKK